MKHAQIVITNQAASPVIHGMLLIKPVPRNAAVLINILARAHIKPAAAVRLVVENIRLVIVPATMFGTEVLVPSQTLV